MREKLMSYKHQIYCQDSEDGIVNKILEIIGIRHKRSCEFGAGNGFSNSNTAQFYFKEWECYLVECNKKLYKELKKNVKKFKCKYFNKKIGINKNNSIDYFFKKHGLNTCLDVLSIDIDGLDYYVLERLEMKPRIIIIEYNPTIPYYLDIYGKKKNNCIGASISALVRIAKEKGYMLVAVTKTNCIFVRREYKRLFKKYEIDLDKIAIRSGYKYIINAFNGDYIIFGSRDFGFEKKYNINLINGQLDNIDYYKNRVVGIG